MKRFSLLIMIVCFSNVSFSHQMPLIEKQDLEEFVFLKTGDCFLDCEEETDTYPSEKPKKIKR